MNRRSFLARLSTLSLLPALTAPAAAANLVDATPPRLDKPKAAWRALLPADAYAVLFEEDTEAPYSSPLNAEKRKGRFLCAACFLPLFSSQHKFDSGTGWPSFWDSLPAALGQRPDHRLALEARTEYHCARCGGHQGHVFKDGPRPTGLRYCNNGLALRFLPEGQLLPALRI